MLACVPFNQTILNKKLDCNLTDPRLEMNRSDWYLNLVSGIVVRSDPPNKPSKSLGIIKGTDRSFFRIFVPAN